MATDFGQTHNPQPVNGMKMFIRTMLDKGDFYGRDKYNVY